MTRPSPILPVLLGAFLGAIALSVSTGPTAVSLRQVVDGLTTYGWRGISFDTGVRVVLTLRLPRALLGALVGGALSSSGVAFQALLRNPLADPYILGVSGGAAVGALAAFLLLPGDSFLPLPLCAFIGAVMAASGVFLMARRSSGVSRERLILMGVVVGAFLNALIMLMVALSPPGKIPGALYWLMGDLGLGTLPRVGVLLPYVAAGVGILFLLSRGLDLLLLGDEPAFTSGLPVEKVKSAVYLTASLLAGSVVAVSGLIGFVGLIVPHGARVLVGSGHRRLLPAAFLLGGTFLILADVLARTASPSGELPVGAVTALSGAPFFLYLLRRNGGKP
ncbi:MAG TPA: iron ABC transporter permease [Candidatus Limnocylindrales bacterium]|nr:iron ABC transporter permease [Candidatus Limnocylindrales bacterium]